MKKALSEWVVPVLKQRGFAGGLPHFRRISHKKVDLLTFQFDKWGGGFVLNLAIGPPEGFTTHWGKFVPPKELTPSYDLGDKTRIQPGDSGSAESWFRFDRPSSIAGTNIYEITAKEVIPFLDKAEEWFSRFDSWTKPIRPIPSSTKVLEQKQLHIVAVGLARHSSEQAIVEALVEAGTPPNDAPIVCRTILESLEKKTHRLWWRFW